MKIIALEEHFVPAALFEAWATVPEPARDIGYEQSAKGDIRRRLEDLADERLREMDKAGIDIQVLSLTVPGVQNLEAQAAIAMSRSVNDLLAATVRARPDRFQGFATLPMATPAQAVTELRRAVCELGLSGAMTYGRVGERCADHRDFWPLYEEAARLRVPLYMHPQSPPHPVRDAYYAGLGEGIDNGFATGGIGWHYETGVQALRMILAGVFDAFPELQVILGHWGEVVLFYLDRIDTMRIRSGGPKRPVSDYWKTNILVTPSGIFSQRYLAWAVEVMGPERILFSTDYPYRIGAPGEARDFLDKAPLDAADRASIGAGNWERLLAGMRRDQPEPAR